VVGIMGYKPREDWEVNTLSLLFFAFLTLCAIQIFWQALNAYDNSLYTGNVDTSMTFMLHKSEIDDSVSVTLEGSLELQPNSISSW